MKKIKVLVFLAAFCVLAAGCQSKQGAAIPTASTAESSASSVTSQEEFQEESEGITSLPEESVSDTSADSTSDSSDETESIPPRTPEAEVIDSVDNHKAGDIIAMPGADLTPYFKSYDIVEGDEVYQRIIGKSFKANSSIALSDLKYLKMIHHNYNGQTQVGEMIVSSILADEILQIFQELYNAPYQIEKMYLIDNYWPENGDPEKADENSIEDNNTSSFCYREMTGGGNLSNHAYGRAIDLNPLQNPYVYSDGHTSHSASIPYLDRESNMAHIIREGDAALRIFKEHGFTWGGDWNTVKDYQHFEK